ncbi:MAG: Crp/Fnr family transcriptional regulator [Fimbriimonadaceae bacterium]|nr:Crp/Fnr family transcriptional regulator [Chitinophagales bacterium]
MFDILRSYFETKNKLTDDQFEFMQTLFIPRKMKKGEFLQREGEIAKYGAFVTKGCLRSYVMDTKGKEHIVQFAPENWWISDTESMANPLSHSRYFIDAIENSEVLLIDLASQEKLMETIPEFAIQYRQGIQKRNAAKDKRIVSSLSATAEERYQEFLKKYSTIAQRIPQHMLASYLGISPETLSRIRKQMSSKKII